jgi:hypothetical protein
MIDRLRGDVVSIETIAPLAWIRRLTWCDWGAYPRKSLPGLGRWRCLTPHR